MSGVRIHDYSNAHWKLDVDIIVPGAGEKLLYITIPKPTKAAQVAEMISYIQAAAKKQTSKRNPNPRFNRNSRSTTRRRTNCSSSLDASS